MPLACIGRLQPGDRVEAIFSDRKWYPAVVNKVTGAGQTARFDVTYEGYGNTGAWVTRLGSASKARQALSISPE